MEWPFLEIVLGAHSIHSQARPEHRRVVVKGRQDSEGDMLVIQLRSIGAEGHRLPGTGPSCARWLEFFSPSLSETPSNSCGQQCIVKIKMRALMRHLYVLCGHLRSSRHR